MLGLDFLGMSVVHWLSVVYLVYQICYCNDFHDEFMTSVDLDTSALLIVISGLSPRSIRLEPARFEISYY
jgi:hypothetical protein